MAEHRVAFAPGIGMALRRGLAALSVMVVALPNAVQARARIAYPVLPPSTETVWHRAPHIAYPRLPADPRVAPDDFADDDIAEELPSPAEQAALIARARGDLGQNYSPRPAIWKIADRDTTIYLFGTIHVLPPGFQWRNAAIDKVVAQAGTLIVESVDDGSGVDALTRVAPGAAKLPPLSARVSPDHRETLARFSAGLPPPAVAVMDTLPTWIAAVAVSFVRDYRAGEIPGPGADDWLEAQFKAAGKPVLQIEDGGQVLAKVNAIPDADQRAMLDLALDAPQRPRETLRAPLHAWAKGEVGPGSPLVVDLQAMGGSASLSKPLLADRNKAWAGELKRRLRSARGTMLFAAGAGHFIGRGSVIDLLQRRGVKVSRVQ